MHLLIILSYKTMILKSIWNELWKRFQVGMVLSFRPHSMCEKVERVTAKTGCTSCTKWTISFEGSGFHTETHLSQRDFNFETYLNSRLFVCSKCTIQSHLINFQPFLTSFVIFHAFTDFFWAIRPWNLKALQMNSEKVESWHGVIISPT